MIPTSRFLFSHLGERTRAVLIALIGLFSSSLLSGASQLLLYSYPGGPMEYNYLGGVLTPEGWVTKLSVNFEVPEAIRIQTIKAWINGGPGFNGDETTATFSVSPVPSEEAGIQLCQTFPVEQVIGAPAKWQGLDSLKWDLQPGVYQFFMSAPDVPIGYGYQGPIPNLDSLLNTFDYRDYSEPGNIPWAPFGLEVYGTPLSAVPEPSLYGLMGAAGLLALAATRQFQRKLRRVS